MDVRHLIATQMIVIRWSPYKENVPFARSSRGRVCAYGSYVRAIARTWTTLYCACIRWSNDWEQREWTALYVPVRKFSNTCLTLLLWGFFNIVVYSDDQLPLRWKIYHHYEVFMHFPCVTVIGSSLPCFWFSMLIISSTTLESKLDFLGSTCVIVWYILNHMCSFLQHINRVGLFQSPTTLMLRRDPSRTEKINGDTIQWPFKPQLYDWYPFLRDKFSYLFGSTCASSIERGSVIWKIIISSMSACMNCPGISHM